MMKHILFNHIQALARLLIALLVSLLAVGCVNDYDDCPADHPEDTPVKLHFTIVTRTPLDYGTRLTRAADIGGEQTGTAAENYLNLAGHDIRFLLFDSDQKLLREFTPDVDITPTETANYITYSVRATVTEPYFAQVAEGATDFYIMVVANGRPYNMTAFGLTPGITTIKDAANQLVTFTPKTITIDPETGGRFGWAPSIPGDANGEYMPMAGLQHFSLQKGAFDGRGPEDFVELSDNGGKDINMLRALAKIEVIDKIGIIGTFDGKADRDVYVEKVGIFGYCATGTILPSYSQWNRGGVLETQQVTTPTMASPVVYKAPPTMNENLETEDLTSLIEFHEDYDAQEARDDKCPVFSVYVPEYSYYEIGSAHPFMRVNVHDKNNTDNVSKFYRLRLATYSNGDAGEDLDALLRNHIYRYEITAVKNQLELRYTLCPMGSGEANIPDFE